MKEGSNVGSRIGKIILGLCLAPILAAIFFVDRFIMVFLVHLKAPTAMEYFDDMKYIGQSVIRVVCFVLTFLIFLYFV